jgi:ribosomal protein S14
METISETRKRAWQTRRNKYGAHGHNGSYGRQRVQCPDCVRMRSFIARLHVEGTLSEGQAAKAAGISRIEIRILSDDLINSGEVPDTRGQP